MFFIDRFIPKKPPVICQNGSCPNPDGPVAEENPFKNPPTPQQAVGTGMDIQQPKEKVWEAFMPGIAVALAALLAFLVWKSRKA